jgi:peptidoglycan hydrolase-like protein with peptidoglycan-binding domain
VTQAREQAQAMVKQGLSQAKGAMQDAGAAAKGAVQDAQAAADGAIDQAFDMLDSFASQVPNFDELLEQVPIRIGHLDPINELNGVLGRLNNLGFDAGSPAAYMGNFTREAIKKFQMVEELVPNGEIDGATLGRLLERHGC